MANLRWLYTHGSIGEFQHTQEPWQSYVERLQQYFIANDVYTAEKQWAILLSIMGGKTYQLIRNLLGPAKPTERSFDEIVEAVQNHYHAISHCPAIQLPQEGVQIRRECLNVRVGVTEIVKIF